MRLVDHVKEAIAAFDRQQIRPALMDGLAPAAHKLVRTTRDADLPAYAQEADRLHALLLSPGCL